MRLWGLSLVGLGVSSVIALTGCVTVVPAQGVAAAPSSAKAHDATVVTTQNEESARHIYRFDFVLTSGEGSPGAVPTSFTMNLRENDMGEIHTGTNVALTTSGQAATGPMSAARVDIGTLLKADYTSVGDDLILHTSTELSGTDEPGAIRKLTAHGDALVTPGKPALIASIADSEGHKKYELTVTATKLR